MHSATTLQTAADLREYTRSNLQCFVPKCLSPEFTTVARKHRRDGFKHLTGGSHAEESLFHRQAKQLLVDWITEVAPGWRADAEISLDAAHSRRADVMATFGYGQRVAFEVQYAKLEVDEDRYSWATRTADYAAAGVTVVWLFGHRGYHMKMRADRIALNVVHHALLDAGMPLLWLNPTTAQVAVPYVLASADGTEFTIPPTAASREVMVWVDESAGFRRTPEGPPSDRIELLEAQRRAYFEAVARDEAREADERRRAEQRRQEEERRVADRAAAQQRERDLAAIREQRAAARRAKRIEDRQRRLDAEAAAWHESPMRRSVLAAHGGVLTLPD